MSANLVLELTLRLIWTVMAFTGAVFVGYGLARSCWDWIQLHRKGRNGPLRLLARVSIYGHALLLLTEVWFFSLGITALQRPTAPDGYRVLERYLFSILVGLTAMLFSILLGTLYRRFRSADRH